MTNLDKPEKSITSLSIDPKPFGFPFNSEGLKKLEQEVFGENWPVAYLINNEKEIHIGESSNVRTRMKQHLSNPKRSQLNKMTIIYGPKFNKSVVLDLEAMLIMMCSVDGKFTLQNQNSGQSLSHNYYQKGLYNERDFPKIWNALQKENLAGQDYKTILNSDLYKFSPYHSLTTEQYDVANQVLLSLGQAVDEGEEHKAFFIDGSPGTGKTLLGVYLYKRIFEWSNRSFDMSDFDLSEIEEYVSKDENVLNDVLSRPLYGSNMKIAFIVPQQALRHTISHVFDQSIKRVKGRQNPEVIGPSELVDRGINDKYDLVIVDESHRLRRRKAMPNYVDFDAKNELLGLGKEGTELDWILKCSRFQIFLYDQNQTVKNSDVLAEDFKKLMKTPGTEKFSLNSQMRVLGGNDYIQYIKEIFSSHPPIEPISFFGKYSFYLFDDLAAMQAQIFQENETWGLARMLAGYAWEWNTRKKGYKDEYDFQIGTLKLRWNSKESDWVNSENAIHEVGSIHTVQGYDLNYAGVIIGDDLKYNEQTHQLEVHKENFYDRKAKESATPEKLYKLVLNTYQVLLTRGIRGTFIYVTDPALFNYLKQYIPVWKNGLQESE